MRLPSGIEQKIELIGSTPEGTKPMMWPDIAELNNVVITPVYPGSNKGAVEFGASHGSEVLGHFRYGLPGSMVKISDLSPLQQPAVRIIEEPTIYGGLLFRHFGHALSESIHRLWPRFALKLLHPAKVAFSLVNHAKVMPYMTEALNFHGLSKHDVIRIDELLCFRRLFVGPQARQMAGPTIIPDYQTLLDSALELRVPTSRRDRKIYVSRLQYYRSGSFYGETYVARKLASQGFEIIYPEAYPLTELVAILRESRVAIFAEGSAIHALELCGSKTPDVLVIGRRPLSKERFTPLLSSICRKWKVSDHWLFGAGFSEDPKKQSGVINLMAVMHDIESFTGILARPALTSVEALDIIGSDVDQLLEPRPSDGSPASKVRAIQLKDEIRSRYERLPELSFF